LVAVLKAIPRNEFRGCVAAGNALEPLPVAPIASLFDGDDVTDRAARVFAETAP
jgi:hypothetical protein